MADYNQYNPRVPFTLGNEFVPIQEDILTFNPFAYTTERGYRFRVDASSDDLEGISMNEAYFYLRDFPQATARNRMFTANLYPADALQAGAGNIQSLLIPCNYITEYNTNPSDVLKPWIAEVLYSGDSTAAVQAVADPSDVNSYLSIQGANSSGAIRYQFNFGDQFWQLLDYKRILGVDIIIDMNFSNGWKLLTANPNEFIGTVQPWLSTGSMYNNDPEPGYVRYANLIDPTTEDSYSDIRRHRIRLGDICPIPNDSTGGWSAYSSFMRGWNNNNIGRFADNTISGNEIWFLLYEQAGSNIYNVAFNLFYVAMEIFYCDETRIATGTRRLNGPFDPATPWVLFQAGLNTVVLQDVNNTGQVGDDPPFTVVAGDYVLTINESNGGDAYTSLNNPNGIAPLNQVRMLNALPSMTGVVNTLPFPLDESVGQPALTSEDSDYVPQLAIGRLDGLDSTGLLPFVSQVYGRQARGEVYGNVVVEQQIDLDSPYMGIMIGEGVEARRPYYDWVRFYARNFGASKPLSVIWREPDLCIGTITPSEFNALPPLTTDGWREVNLQVSPAVTGAFEGAMTLAWTAPLERESSRWEILGAASPAISGTEYSYIGGRYNQLPPNLQPGIATYGAEDHVMTWRPHLGPFVDTPAADTTSDVAVILGAQQPMVSGFAVEMETLPISGIGEDCGVDPCGIPTGIYYNQLTWDLPPLTTKVKDRFERTYPTGFSPPSPPAIDNNTFGTPTYGPDWVANTHQVTNSAGVNDGTGYMFPGGMYAAQGIPLSQGGGLAVSQSSNGYAFTADDTDLHITGDFSVIFYGRLDSWSLGLTDQTIAGRWDPATNNRSWRMYFNAASEMVLEWSTDGTAGTVHSVATGPFYSPPSSYTDGSVQAIRMRLDVNNGGGGYDVYFATTNDWVYTAADYPTITWSESLITSTSSGTTSVFAGTAQLEVGSYANGTQDRASGTFYTVALADSGGLVRYAYFNGQDAGTTTFLDDTSAAVWDVVANASITATTELFNRMDMTVTLGLDNYQPNMLLLSDDMYFWDLYFGQLPPDLQDDVANGGSWSGESSTKRLVITTWGTSTFSPGDRQWYVYAVDMNNPFVMQYNVLAQPLNTFSARSRIKVRMAYDTARFMAKVWDADDEEPDLWLIDNLMNPMDGLAQDVWMGIRFYNINGNLSEPVVTVEDFELTPPRFWFGYYEIQRMDEVDTEWKTICKNTSPASNSFRDFEARTGVETSYRIRQVDAVGFPGEWSPTISITIPSPGVTGDESCLGDGAHLLIFTSNENQDGAHSLAYSNAWEGSVEEDLTFPEGGFTQLQLMYNKNFYTAFRPMERGGEQFTRNVLVQAAAIPPASMDGFNALSDMAWDNINYVCVRDEDGNRWFASVNVPNGTIKNRRQLYLAQIEVTEVTDTPTPVDAPWEP